MKTALIRIRPSGREGAGSKAPTRLASTPALPEPLPMAFQGGDPKTRERRRWWAGAQSVMEKFSSPGEGGSGDLCMASLSRLTRGVSKPRPQLHCEACPHPPGTLHLKK